MTQGYRLRWRVALAFTFVVAGFAERATAQGLGVRTGMNVNPDQFSVGAQYAMPLAEHLWFQPSGDAGFGDGATLFTLSSNVVYRHPMARRSPWTAFAGGGPELNVYRVAGVQDTFAGATLFGGVQHSSGLFVQAARGFLDSPQFRLGVGYVMTPKVRGTKTAPRRR